MKLHRSPLGLPLLLLLAPAASAQVPGVSREQMWPAPTAEDWARPCLITWQRNYEDALAVSLETGEPILICVNMDGEIASEHYAGIRYRDPEISAIYDPYVTVIASVYRHSPRDHDELGQRILCPRFGSVTCGEHIAIEPGLFGEFFNGDRVAPRHIMVELDRSEVYDIYYAFDTDSVFAAVREGIAEREIVPTPIARADRPLLDRVASHEISDREAVERAYLEGDGATRRKLLQAVLRHVEVSQVGLLRLAVFGFDVELGRLAREALARSSSVHAVDLINEALRVPMEAAEREALIAALERIGEQSPRARTLAVVHRGLAGESSRVDVQDWFQALEGTQDAAEAYELSELESRVDARVAAIQERPEDPDAILELAEASLALAVDPQTAVALAADFKTAPKYARLMFEDAYREALHAEELGARGWRVDAAIALSSFYLGQREEAYARAEAAVSDMPPGVKGWNGMAVLGLFAEARQKSMWKAVRNKQAWPSEWLTDVHAAYTVIADHPLGTDAHAVAHYDFLRIFGAAGQAARVLETGLVRFPDSWDLHDRLRGRILKEKGVDGLETVYGEMLRAVNASPNLEWFAGYAALVAAESHRRNGHDVERAVSAYERAIGHYDRAIELNPECVESADHYAALAMGGRARLALETAELERSLADLLASFGRRPEAAGTLDGLNISPVGTAKMLLARLNEEGRGDLAQDLQDALDALDPALLRLPAFERGGPRSGGRGGIRSRPGR